MQKTFKGQAIQAMLIVFLVLCSLMAQAQNVGIGTPFPHASAQLEMASTSSGILVPRMTTAQRMAIVNPANGLLVYDINTNSFWYTKSNTWTEIGNAAEGWKISGNAGATAANFLGTVDEQPLQFKVNNRPSGFLSWDISSSTSFGYESLASNTGPGNVGVGYWALRNNTTGVGNTAVGTNSLIGTTTGNYNTAVGQATLSDNLVGAENTAVGFSALNKNISEGNTAFGILSLAQNTTGALNTALGGYAMFLNTTGSVNTAVGYGALAANTTGGANVAIGRDALKLNTTGDRNVANGWNALAANTTANSNIAIGPYALFSNTDRSNLVAIGDSALYNNGVGATSSTHATKNTAVGSKALFANTTGSYNTATGADALLSNTTGFYNTATGADALLSNTIGSYNTANGRGALFSNTTGVGNTANGAYALYSNTTGIRNIAIGLGALFSNTTGFNNTANGWSALEYNTTGSNNTANGLGSLANNTTGSFNIANGLGSLRDNTTGSNNSAVGLNALAANTTGTNNTAIGYFADVATGDLTNATAIGNNAVVACSNCMVLGNNSVNVGIGISNPTNKLHVIGKTATTNFQMTSGAVAGHVLQSDAEGNASWQSIFSLEQDPQVGANVTNYVSKWNGNALVASTIFDNGNVGIGSIGSNLAKLTVTGNALLHGQVGVNAIATNTALLVKSLPGNTWLNVQQDNNNVLRFAVASGGTVGINAHSATTALNVRMSSPSITRILDLQTTNGPSMFSVSSNGTVQSNASINAGTTMSAPAGAVFGTGALDATLNVYGTRGIALSGATNDFITPTGEAFSFGNYFKNLNGQVFVTETFRITSNGNVNIPTGNLSVSGSLSKGSGSFKIDHPLDPYNKYLYHSFVESPDMMNVYNGNITTNAQGEAVVEMPDWFEALNKDFRYQLTVIGEFAQAIVGDKLANNRFSIKTDKPGIEVSWQITGIRKDRFAEENRIPIEVDKKGEEIGTLLHPSKAGSTYSKK